MQNTAQTEAIDGEEKIEGGLEQKYLTFWTDQELFGIPISDVVQIISIQDITPLPDFPKYAKGVINLRGNIIPVIDIRIRFGKPEIPYSENTCIIVTRIEETYIGFIVDSVDEVTDIDDDDITDAPKVSKDITNRYLSGIGQKGEKVVLLLDVGKILTENEYEIVCETAEKAPAAETAKETAEKVPAAETAKEAPVDKAAPEKKTDAGGSISLVPV